MENNELIKKAKNCETIDELKELVKENNLSYSDSQIESYFNFTHSYNKEISDDELNSAVGGVATGDCDDSDKIRGFNDGDIVFYTRREFNHKNVRCKVLGCEENMVPIATYGYDSNHVQWRYIIHKCDAMGNLDPSEPDWYALEMFLRKA